MSGCAIEGPFPVFDLPAIRTGTLSPGPISGHLSASLRALEADDEATVRAGETDLSGRRCCEPLLPGESARSGLSLSELSSRSLKNGLWRELTWGVATWGSREGGGSQKIKKNKSRGRKRRPREQGNRPSIQDKVSCRAHNRSQQVRDIHGDPSLQNDAKRFPLKTIPKQSHSNRRFLA